MAVQIFPNDIESSQKYMSHLTLQDDLEDINAKLHHLTMENEKLKELLKKVIEAVMLPDMKLLVERDLKEFLALSYTQKII